MVVRELAPQVFMGSGLSPLASPGMTELNAFVNGRDSRDRRAAPYYGLNQEHSGGTMMTRRTVGLGVAGAAAAAGLSKLFGGASEAAPAKTFPVSLPDEEWKKQLSPEQYYVLRQHGTERAGTSPLDREKRRGTFTCAGCGQAALRLGRPSSTAAPAGRASTSRSTARSAPGGQRLLHDAAPKCIARAAAAISATSSTTGRSPPGLRYCMNGVAMKFRAAEGAA